MGIGFISLGLFFNFTSILMMHGQNIFPTYVCYIFVLMGVLLVKRKINEKYFTYALLPIALIILWQFIAITNYLISSILTIVIWYLVLEGIYRIPFKYQGKRKYKKELLFGYSY